MNSIMQQLVNQKINTMTAGELMQISAQYQIPLNQQQAESVVKIIQEEPVDVANQVQVNKIIERLQSEVDPHVSAVVGQLLKQFGHLF